MMKKIELYNKPTLSNQVLFKWYLMFIPFTSILFSTCVSYLVLPNPIWGTSP